MFVSTPRQRLLDAKFLDAAMGSSRDGPEEDEITSEMNSRETDIDMSRKGAKRREYRVEFDNSPTCLPYFQSGTPSRGVTESVNVDQQLSMATETLANADQALIDLGIWRENLRREEECINVNSCISGVGTGLRIEESSEEWSHTAEENPTLLDVAHSALTSSRKLADRLEEFLDQILLMNSEDPSLGISSASSARPLLKALPLPAPVRAESVSRIGSAAAPDRDLPITQSVSSDKLERLRFEIILASSSLTPRKPVSTTEWSSQPGFFSESGIGYGEGQQALEAAAPNSSPSTLVHRLRVRELMGEVAAAPEVRAQREAAEESLRRQCEIEEDGYTGHSGSDLIYDAGKYTQEFDDLLAQFEDSDSDNNSN